MTGRKLTDEEKTKMAAGRKAAFERRVLEAAKDAAAKDVGPEPGPETAEEYAKKAPGVSPDRDDDTQTEPVSLELSSAELERIRAEAKKKVDAELADVGRAERKKLMAKALDDEILRQRSEAGLIDYRDDLLEILIDVAPFSDDIKIDGTAYQHGRWYTVDRRKYDALREIMARSWDSEERAGNPNRRFRREVAGSMNPLANEQRMPDGTLTLGGAPRVNGRSGAVVG